MKNQIQLIALLVAASGAADPVAAQTGTGAACPPEVEVLLERTFAEDAGLSPGDRIGLRATAESEPCPARVAGTFVPPPDPAKLAVDRPRALFHLPHLAALRGRGGEVDHFTVRVDPAAAPDRLATDLERLLPGTQVLSTARVTERASTTFVVVSRFHRAIAVITLIAGGVFLACIMVLKVEERRGPIAAARLVGIPRRTLIGWTVMEAAILSTVGGITGLGLGLLASRLINLIYRRVYETTLAFSLVTPEMAVQALVLAVVLGMGAGAFAARRLFRVDALEEVGR